MKAVIAMDLTNITQIDEDMTIYTIANNENKKWADAHKGIGIHFIKVPTSVKVGDNVVNAFVKKIMKVQDADEFEDMLHFVYFAHMTAFYVSNRDYEELWFESQPLCEKVLIQFNNSAKYEDKIEFF